MEQIGTRFNKSTLNEKKNSPKVLDIPSTGLIEEIVVLPVKGEYANVEVSEICVLF